MKFSNYLEVNLSHLEHNIQIVQSLAPHKKVIAMVKADAYGHGMTKLSEFMLDNSEIKSFGCASVPEALSIYQKIKKNKSHEIFVFSNTNLECPETRKIYLETSIVPVIHQSADLDMMLEHHDLKTIPLVLKFNSGMNRLGLHFKDIESRLPLLKKRGIKHLMTHFARSTKIITPQDKTFRQKEVFNQLKKRLSDEGVSVLETSVANSGAIEQSFGLDETHVRAGLILYGPHSCSQQNNPATKNISRWVTKILTLFKVKRGTPVGYGVNVVQKDCLMAIIPVGYGDGFLTYYSGAPLIVNGVKGKVFGRVNMDMTFVQFDLKDENKIKKNDMVEIWNHDPSSIEFLAQEVQTTPYQLMCAISPRVPRIYIFNDK